MYDIIISKIIKFFRIILRLLDKTRFIPTRALYSIYFKYIMYNVTKSINFEEIDKENKEINRKIKNKHIWVMWWQGIDHAPAIVVKNIERLECIFKTEVMLITEKNFEMYTDIDPGIVTKFRQGKITFTQWSDIVRFNLLKNNGGIWIDSTVVVYPTIKELSIRKDFFTLGNVKEDFTFISRGKWTGWCIGGDSDYELFSFVNSFFKCYFKNHDVSIDYFLVDDAIMLYYERSDKFKNVINNNLYPWNNYILASNLFNVVDDDFFKCIESDPYKAVQKITYKQKSTKHLDKDCVMNKLLNDKL